MVILALCYLCVCLVKRMHWKFSYDSSGLFVTLLFETRYALPYIAAHILSDCWCQLSSVGVGGGGGCGGGGVGVGEGGGGGGDFSALLQKTAKQPVTAADSDSIGAQNIQLTVPMSGMCFIFSQLVQSNFVLFCTYAVDLKDHFQNIVLTILVSRPSPAPLPQPPRRLPRNTMV